MNKINTVLILLIFSFSLSAQAQCKSFANSLQDRLYPYIHDGSLNAINLRTGQNAKLQKTFYSGQSYRMMIAGAENLPAVQVEILDLSGNTLFINKNMEQFKTWDLKFDGTQQLIISITVPEQNGGGMESGCVATLFGFWN